MLEVANSRVPPVAVSVHVDEPPPHAPSMAMYSRLPSEIIELQEISCVIWMVVGELALPRGAAAIALCSSEKEPAVAQLGHDGGE
jgi:hypothetical protein